MKKLKKASLLLFVFTIFMASNFSPEKSEAQTYSYCSAAQSFCTLYWEKSIGGEVVEWDLITYPDMRKRTTFN